MKHGLISPTNVNTQEEHKMFTLSLKNTLSLTLSITHTRENTRQIKTDMISKYPPST